jgi:hypothetical protein
VQKSATLSPGYFASRTSRSVGWTPRRYSRSLFSRDERTKPFGRSACRKAASCGEGGVGAPSVDVKSEGESYGFTRRYESSGEKGGDAVSGSTAGGGEAACEAGAWSRSKSAHSDSKVRKMCAKCSRPVA